MRHISFLSAGVLCLTWEYAKSSQVQESYHCLQKKNNHSIFDYPLNAKIETKYATFLYLDKQGKFDEVPGYDYEKQCLINYRNNPTPQNYLGLIDYVRNLRSGNSKPYYNLAESAEYRTMFDLGPIFDCY